MPSLSSRPATDNGAEAQLRALETSLASAFTKKDIDAVMAVYAPGKSLFVFDLVGPPGVYSSWDGYREAWSHFFAMFPGSLYYTISDLEIAVSGDVAYSRSLHHLSGNRADGTPYDITARVTDVYRKIGPKWLIVQEHASLPLDRQTFKPILHSPL